MLKRLRGYEIALGAVAATALWAVLIAFASQQSPPNSHPQPSQHRHRENEVGHSVRPEAIAKQDEAHSSKERRWYNTFLEHTPDWFVAFFTFTLWWSTRKLWKATVGLLQFAGEQARDMKASISAAEKSAEIAERTLIVGQRAYVAAKDVTPQFSIIDRQIRQCLLHVKFQNVGTTPAINCALRVGFVLTPATDPEIPPRFDREAIQSDGSTMTLGAGLTAQSEGLLFNWEHLAGLGTGETRLFLWALFEYHDVFEGTPLRHTQACCEVMMQQRFLREVPEGARFTSPLAFRFVGPQNTSD